MLAKHDRCAFAWEYWRSRLNFVERHPSCVNVRWLVNPPNMDLLLAFARLSDVVGGLHSHERVHLHSERFLDAERHIPGKVSFAVEQAGQRGPGNMKLSVPIIPYES